MQVVERSAIVTFTSAQMFALVNDVARYPDFLPWCTGARVEPVSNTQLLASVQVARGVLKTSFTTRNDLTPDSRIDLQLVDGPFKRLKGAWNFDAIGERGCRVRFRLEFEFRNRLTASAVGGVFESICGSIVDAFAHRAQKIYV